MALERWGLWAKTSLPGDWPRQTVLAKLIEFGAFGAASQAGTIAAVERDELCERIERWVTSRDVRDRTLIVYQFAWHEPDEALARRLDVEPATVRKFRHDVLRDLQSYLEGMRAVYEQQNEKVAW
jgi:DNA-directed RNA polymerase specialized sigma24 family protein